MKRLIAFVLSLVLALQVCGYSRAFAAQTQTITVSSAAGKVGDIVSVEVGLENNPGFSTASIKVCYDEAMLTLVSAEIDSRFSSGAFVNFNLPYITFVRANNVTADGVFLTLKFKILSDSGDGRVTIDYAKGDISDVDENDITFRVIGGTVTAGCSHSYSYQATKAPTTSTAGTLTGACSGCSGTTTVTLPKLSTTDYTYTVVKEATATSDGTGRYTWKNTAYGSFHFDVTIGKTGQVAQIMTVSSASGRVGDTVSVDVSLQNNPGFSTAALKISYDQTRMSLVSAELDSRFSAGAFVNYNLPFITFVRSDNISEDGVFLRLAFRILSEKGNGEVTVAFSDGDISDIDENNVAFQVVGGTVSIGDSAALPGDLDLDQDADSDDLTLLARHIGGIETVSAEAIRNADINGDGQTNSDDLTRLARHVGGIEILTANVRSHTESTGDGDVNSHDVTIRASVPEGPNAAVNPVPSITKSHCDMTAAGSLTPCKTVRNILSCL